jgi:protein gp37
MNKRTKISWADLTINFQSGCTEARFKDGYMDPACVNCYARLQSARMPALSAGGTVSPGKQATGLLYEGAAIRTGRAAKWTGQIKWDLDLMIKGFKKIKKGDVAFVGSMTDLFHKEADYKMWTGLASQLRQLPKDRAVILLTKRVDRLLAFQQHFFQEGMPSNAWVGVTAGCQQAADERIPTLLEVKVCDGGVRLVSVEPMTGPVDLKPWIGGLHYVIIGGESGDKARPMHPDWARALRDQCVAAGVKFHFKQWGMWSTVYDRDVEDPDWQNRPKAQNNNERYLNLAGGHGFHGDRVVFVRNVGKEQAGRTLDGQTWDERPEIV